MRGILRVIRKECKPIVSDKHCENCEYFEYTGTSHTVKNAGKKTGFCPFVRCVKRYGFKSEQKALQERIGG